MESAYLELIVGFLHPFIITSILGYGSNKTMYPWYSNLRRPPFTPPDWAFPVAWSYLYTSMGYAGYLVWKSEGDNQTALYFHLIHLILNGTWSQTFFKLHLLGSSLIHIILLWIAILITFIAFYQVNTLAGLLFIPYLGWVSLATYLCIGFWKLNSGNVKQE
jgi:translocator protein